MGFDSFGQQEE